MRRWVLMMGKARKARINDGKAHRREGEEGKQFSRLYFCQKMYLPKNVSRSNASG